MTPTEHAALLAALCPDCGGLTKIPNASLPSALLRWCLCVFEELGEEKPKEPMGFGVKARKAGD